MRVLTVTAAAIAVGLVATQKLAVAAPQILAAAPTATPVAFHCQDETCHAELQTLCLEEDREGPATGTRYRLAAGSSLHLVARDQAGRIVELPADIELSITSLRRWTVSRVSVDRHRLRRAGIASLSVEVGDDVSFVPVPRADDDRPHSASGIAEVTGNKRAIATEVLTRRGSELLAAQYLSKFGTALSPAEATRARGSEDYWRGIRDLLATAPADSQPHMTKAYDHCRASTFGLEQRLPGCFKQQADGIMSEINKDYWQQARPRF